MNEHPYSFLLNCVIKENISEKADIKRISRQHHYWFPVQDKDLKEARDALLPFPEELEKLYKEVGFGFLHCRKERINRVFDPQSLIQVNLLMGRYKFDNEIKQITQSDFLVFFETFEGEYLSICKERTEKGNAIYYKNKLIAESLQEFLYEYTEDRHYIKNRYEVTQSSGLFSGFFNFFK